MLLKLRPTSIIWILVHTIVFLVGIIVFDVPQIAAFLGKPFAEALGGGLAATGAAGVFIYVYVRQADSLSESINLIAQSGLTKIFEGRAARIKAEYDQRLRKFDYLDVIGFGLSDFREDYKTEFARWAQHSKVRLLLIDPHFPTPDHSFAELRDREEKTNPGKIAADVKQFAHEFAELSRSSQNFQIRLMRCTPGLNIFRIDDEIFFGPYLMDRASRNSFTFECRRGGFLFTALLSHFEAIWTNPTLSTPLT